MLEALQHILDPRVDPEVRGGEGGRERERERERERGFALRARAYSHTHTYTHTHTLQVLVYVMEALQEMDAQAYVSFLQVRPKP